MTPVPMGCISWTTAREFAIDCKLRRPLITCCIDPHAHFFSCRSARVILTTSSPLLKFCRAPLGGESLSKLTVFFHFSNGFQLSTRALITFEGSKMIMVSVRRARDRLREATTSNHHSTRLFSTPHQALPWRDAKWLA
jgi:hypothetical protein